MRYLPILFELAGIALVQCRVSRCDEGEAPRTERVTRDDRSPLRSPTMTADGYMLAEGYAAKETILAYKNPDGSTRRELIRADELGKRSSLDTLTNKPITLKHPGKGKVDADSFGSVGAGVITQPAEFTNGYVKINTLVMRKDAINAVKRGTAQLSCGYDCDLVWTPGEHPTLGRYDAVQTNRVYNHVAIVDTGRAGPDCGLRTDSADVDPLPKRIAMNPTLLALLALGMLTRVDHADDMAPLDGVDKLKEDKALAEKARAAKLDSVERIDAVTARINGFDAEMHAYAKRYVELRALAASYKVDAADLDNGKLARAIATKIKPDLRTDASDDFVNALLDVAGATVGAKHPASFDGSRIAPRRTDGTEPVMRTVRVDEEDPSVRRRA